MFQTEITRILGIKHPIIGGTMMWITDADFAAAISNAGGLGIISSPTYQSREELRGVLGGKAFFPDRRRDEPQFCTLGQRRGLALAEPLQSRILIHCQASDRYNIWFIRHELLHHAQYEAMYSWRIPSWLIAAKGPLVPAWWWEGF